jgi:hypothetical protein
MLYPTALLVTAVLIVLGLGLYQRLNVEVERQSDRKDEAEQRKSGDETDERADARSRPRST